MAKPHGQLVLAKTLPSLSNMLSAPPGRNNKSGTYFAKGFTGVIQYGQTAIWPTNSVVSDSKISRDNIYTLGCKAMDIAIIGAAGSCGRQLAVQILDRRLLHPGARLQLVGHHGGRSADELWGLRADLEDAFVDSSPTIEVILDPSGVDADLVVMLAGMTISTDPNASTDRAALGASNYRMFKKYADTLNTNRAEVPIVIVQSNPIELGVEVFARRLGRYRVLGAGAWSDTLRLRAEIATDLKVSRPQVHALMLGEHGDNIVPLWSQLRVRGKSASETEVLINRARGERKLADLPQEVRQHKAQLLANIKGGNIAQAYEQVQSLPADLRATVKPFFTHFTAGHTTEITTAHSVAEIVNAFVEGEQLAIPAQVMLEGDWLDLHGVVAVPIILAPWGWEHVHPLELDADEICALQEAARAVSLSNGAFISTD